MLGLARKTAALLILICLLLTGCGRDPGRHHRRAGLGRRRRPAGGHDVLQHRLPHGARAVRSHAGGQLKSGVNPLEQKRTELQQFVTDGFLTSIDNMRSELEASPFIDARSFDAKLSIEKITKDNSAATVRIGLSGRISGQHKLNVYLVKIEGQWKIDDVKLVEEFSLAERPERSG